MSLLETVNNYVSTLAVTSNAFYIFLKNPAPWQKIVYADNKYVRILNPSGWSVASILGANIYGVAHMDEFNRILEDVLEPYILHPEEYHPITHKEFANELVVKLLTKECIVLAHLCYSMAQQQRAQTQSVQLTTAPTTRALLAGLAAMKKKKL